MEDEFQVGVCGGNTWNISRSNLFGSSPCSMVVNDIGWPNNQDSVIIMDMKSPSKSNEDSTGNSSSNGITNHLLSSTSPDHIWSQQNLLFNGGRTEDNNYNIDILLQEAATCLNSSTMNYWQETTSFFDCPQILVDSSLISSSTFSSDLTVNKSCQEPSKTPKFLMNSSSNSYSSSLASQSTESQLRQSLSPINNLIINDDVSSCMLSKNSLFDLSSINDKNKPNLHIVNGKINEEAYLAEESGFVPVTKRPRIEPLPTFKVRKEKFGDRVTALQQLVSPFGKTDTASVLHEAIEYIKFLHNQVKTLMSSPYLDYGSPRLQLRDNQTINVHNDDKLLQDLRSRGLCLVPISSTLSVAAETSADLWTPTFMDLQASDNQET